MEGTAGLVVLAGFLERDAPVDYFDDIDTVEQFVYESFCGIKPAITNRRAEASGNT